MTVWTSPVVNRFDQLFAEGLTYNAIAEGLSKEFKVTISRNAAIGFGKRRNMPTRKKDVPVRKPEVRLEHRGKEVKFVPIPYVPKKAAGKGTLRIEQLRPRSCRWPFGDQAPYTYCGCKSVEGGPYCEDHMKLGHVRRQPTAVA